MPCIMRQITASGLLAALRHAPWMGVYAEFHCQPCWDKDASAALRVKKYLRETKYLQMTTLVTWGRPFLKRRYNRTKKFINVLTWHSTQTNTLCFYSKRLFNSTSRRQRALVIADISVETCWVNLILLCCDTAALGDAVSFHHCRRSKYSYAAGAKTKMNKDREKNKRKTMF